MPQIDKVNSVLRFELSLCVGCMDGGAITPVVCNVGQDDCFISFCFADQNSLCLLLFEYVQLHDHTGDAVVDAAIDVCIIAILLF